MTDPRISFSGDSCVLATFEDRIDPAINARCLALAREHFAGVREIVPGYNTVALYFDPLIVHRDALAAELSRAAARAATDPVETAATVNIAVRYGGADGPDLRDVAASAGCSEAEVIRIHTGNTYRVYMLGFLPGFAYLGSVDPRIAMPRLDTPRIKVAAGSVGIAGTQTGVYPCETPAGWRIIGRTDATMFDILRPNPSLLEAGQRVTFTAI